jgi:hypothetical protein
VQLRIPPAHVRELTARQFDAEGADPIIELAWQAALRLIADNRPDYRS